MNEVKEESMLNRKLIDLGLDRDIYESIAENTRCEFVRDLWGLSAKETCREIGLNKDQLNRLLTAMEQVRPPYMHKHIEHCRWMMELLMLQ